VIIYAVGPDSRDIDITGIENSPPESEDCSIWAHNSNTDPLATPAPNQQSPCQTDRTPVRDTTACTDASFDVSPSSPESQPCPSASDEQQLATKATGSTSESNTTMIDALSDAGSCHGTQSTPASPSTHTYSSAAAIPEEMSQTLPHDSEVSASTSRKDATPGTRISSPAVRLLLESQPGPYTSCGHSDTASEASETESGSPFGTRESPPPQELPSPCRSRRRSSHVDETVKDIGSGADAEGSSGEDSLDIPERVLDDEDYCPSPLETRGRGSEDDSDDEEQHSRKRRRASQSPHSSVRSTSTSAQSSRQRRSRRPTAQIPRGRRTSVFGTRSPTPSQEMQVPSEASTCLARFEEWPLRGVSLKRITEGDKMTFQLQFESTIDLCQPRADRSVSHPEKGRGPPKASLSALRSSRDKWTSEEENKVRMMRRNGCSWTEIQHALPHRSQGSIQVRYSTKLNKEG
jgi:hypothetical protein